MSVKGYLVALNTQSLLSTKLPALLPWALPLLLLFSRALADITVLTIGLIFLVRSLKLQDWSWTKHSWFKLSLLFWVYLLFINTPLSIDSADSLSRALFYIRWPLFAAALAYWLLNRPKFHNHFLIALLLTCGFIIFDTSLQYFIGTDLFGHTKPTPTRLTGPYNKPIPGIMMLRVWFIALSAAVLLPSIFSITRRIAFILCMLSIGLLFIFITGERMALILFVAASSTILIGLLMQHSSYTKKVLLGITVIFSLFITAVILNPATAERSIYSIIEKLAHFPESDYGLVFRAAIAAWQAHPIFGSGLHTYRTVCESMNLLPQWGINCSHPHNIYLHIAAETGVIGLILFVTSILSIYYTALFKSIKTKQWLIVGLSFAILSVCFWPLIGGISLLNNGMAALVWLGVGWVLYLSKHKDSNSFH